MVIPLKFCYFDHNNSKYVIVLVEIKISLLICIKFTPIKAQHNKKYSINF